MTLGFVELWQADTPYEITAYPSVGTILYAMAVNLLMLAGTVTGGWVLAREALAANAKLADSNDEYYRTKIVTARFYAQHVLPRARAHAEALAAGSADIMALAEDQF